MIDVPPQDGPNYGHFRFQDANVDFSWTLIRKNASSTMVGWLGQKARVVQSGSQRLEKIMEFRVDSAHADMSKNKILILRDPVERAVSTWLNKFARPTVKGKDHIHEEAEKITGVPARDLNFEKFVLGYVTSGLASDVHLNSQRSHLGNIRYNRVIHPSGLWNLMYLILGSEQESEYFRTHRNSTLGTPKPDMSRVVVRALEKFYQEDYELLESVRITTLA